MGQKGKTFKIDSQYFLSNMRQIWNKLSLGLELLRTHYHFNRVNQETSEEHLDSEWEAFGKIFGLGNDGSGKLTLSTEDDRKL